MAQLEQQTITSPGMSELALQAGNQADFKYLILINIAGTGGSMESTLLSTY